MTGSVEIRNISIIAHVDHGKTTLVDGLLRHTGAIENRNKTERVMDSMDLERERGITIRAKNATVYYKGTQINIIDTPGHADFGGEVERVLSMADSCLLLVDAFEGPMPQTRFVLDKSLRLGHKPIVVINKIDRENAEPDSVLDRVFDLFDDLGASSEQLDFPVCYASARQGLAVLDLKDRNEPPSLEPLLDLILEHVKPAQANSHLPLLFQIMNLEYDEYVGRLAIGRIFQGKIKRADPVTLIRLDGQREKHKITRIYGYQGLQRKEKEEALAGDVVALAGIDELYIGETIAAEGTEQGLPPISVDEPTVSMQFMVNDSPFAGKEGQYVTSRNLKERLEKEVLTNVALRVIFDPATPEMFQVQGRGDLHLSILIESLRREGYELQVSRPQVILKRDNGKIREPYEQVVIDVPEEYAGVLIQELNRRKGLMESMHSGTHGVARIEYTIPTRSLIGFRSFLITESRGTAALNSRFLEYREYAGAISGRKNGALVSSEDGKSVAYALFNIQERGALFIGPGVPVYKGMIVGECARDTDLDVNPCKEKKLTNVRASGADEAIRLTPPIDMNLEKCLQFMEDDELLEVTPGSVRLRKRYLDPSLRKKHAREVAVS